MITLRELARSDRAIGAVTTDECRMIAAVLDAASRSWLFRRHLPAEFRGRALGMRMLSGILARSPAERDTSSIQVKIYQEMQRAK